MARKRLIAPEFFTHGALYDAEAQSGLPLRVAFAGMWTQADRRGYFRWRPRELKLAVLPYDNVDFDEVLNALARFGFVVRYVVDGKDYGRIPSFTQWQSFHHHEKGAADIPEPPAVVSATGKERASPDIGDTVPIIGGARPGAGPDNGEPSPTAVITAVSTAVITDDGSASADNAPDPSVWPKSWAFDTSKILAELGVVIAVDVIGKHAKPCKSLVPWEEWPRVLGRMARDGQFAFGVPAALRKLGEYRDSAWIIGAGGNEAEILAYCKANPVRAAR